MSRLDVTFVDYQGKSYPVTSIPDVFTHQENCNLLIGSHSLNLAVFDNITGYPDELARIIDERIYAYIDDSFFECSAETFLDNVIKHLD